MRATALTFLLVVSLRVFGGEAPSVTTLPSTPLIESTSAGQQLNFDFLVRNPGAIKLEITTIEMSMFTASGKFLGQRRLQPNGMSILSIPNRFVEPGGRLVVFNPFHTLASELSFATLRYEFVFGDNKESDDIHRVKVDVKPRAFTPRTALQLPVRGRVFVHDGHDFYSHHRRLDITGDMTTAMKIESNMTRYAHDFVTVDDRGEMRKHESEKPSDYYCFGAPVHAPGDGVVLEAVSDVPDNAPEYRWKPVFAEIIKNIHLIGGNYVFVDHGNGEYSFLAHLKHGSVSVKPGDRVTRGQKIGEIGNSGDAMFPHLHYQLQSDAVAGEGLPSYFMDFERVVGDKTVRVKRGAVDTGDVLIAR